MTPLPCSTQRGRHPVWTDPADRPNLPFAPAEKGTRMQPGDVPPPKERAIYRFEGFTFDAFIKTALGKSTAELTDADRPALERIRNEDRRATEARFRDLEQSCRAK